MQKKKNDLTLKLETFILLISIYFKLYCECIFVFIAKKKAQIFYRKKM